MRYETKKGLFKPKPLPISKIYNNRMENDKNFTYIILNFSKEPVIINLLFEYVKSLPFTLSSKYFKKQLKLLEPLTVDEQIRIISKTVEKGWKSLIFEYNRVVKERLGEFDSE